MHGEEEIEYVHPKAEPILKETYGIEILRSCIWYLCKQAKFRNIKNKFHYCKASLEDGAMKLSGVKTEEIPDSLQHYYQ